MHAAIVVRLAGRELLVDVGYGAPFTEPLPRDVPGDVEVRLGRDRYVLAPRDAAWRSRLQLFRDGVLVQGYVLSPTPRPIGHFRAVVADSFRDDAVFMNALMLVRFGERSSVAIYNRLIVRSAGEQATVETLPGRSELVQAIEHEFGIPARVSRLALAGVRLRRDPYE